MQRGTHRCGAGVGAGAAGHGNARSGCLAGGSLALLIAAGDAAAIAGLRPRLLLLVDDCC